MQRPSLTRPAQRVGGRLAHVYEAEGRRVTVWDSALNVMLVIELFSDGGVLPEEKAYALQRMMFPHPEELGDDPAPVVAALLWEVCGLDVTGDRRAEAPVFDFEEDAGRIKASLLMAYGLDWDEACRDITYAEACDLLAMLLESGQETPFREAVYYRTAKPPKATRHNAAERAAFAKARAHYRLRGGNSKELARIASDRTMSGVAEAIRGGRRKDTDQDRG